MGTPRWTTQCQGFAAYDLTSCDCTTFAIDAAQAAGVTPPASSTLGVHDPNALYEGDRGRQRSQTSKAAGAHRRRHSPAPHRAATFGRGADMTVGVDVPLRAAGVDVDPGASDDLSGRADE